MHACGNVNVTECESVLVYVWAVCVPVKEFVCVCVCVCLRVCWVECMLNVCMGNQTCDGFVYLKLHGSVSHKHRCKQTHTE